MLLAERFSLTTAASLRNNGVPFADERGNCFLDYGPVLIDIRGAGSAQRKAGKETRNGRALNLFVPKRAQVAAMILLPENSVAVRSRHRELFRGFVRNGGKHHQPAG